MAAAAALLQPLKLLQHAERSSAVCVLESLPKYDLQQNEQWNNAAETLLACKQHGLEAAQANRRASERDRYLHSSSFSRCAEISLHVEN